jgi:hypothetical protein
MHSSTTTLYDKLSQLLERNQMSQPNGQPLYQYQLTEEEYLQFKTSLKCWGKAPSRGNFDKTFCSVFCLFCSEWFRREYQGGWSWHPIWQLLGYEIDANDRSYVVSKGLRDYWQRPVSKYSGERNSYLGSVFREGGLPYQLLSSDGHRIQDVFKGILRGYDTAKLMGRSVRQLVALHLQHLPEAFKQDTTVDLVAEMAERLVQLVDQYNLDQQPDPVKYLDEQQAGWRRLFPIPLDQKTGSAFLGGLLSSASQQRQSRAKNQGPIVCLQYLKLGSDVCFKVQIQLAQSLVVELKREQLGSGRVELHIAEGNRTLASMGIAYVQFDGAATKICPRNRACEFLRKDLQQPLMLLIKQAGQTLLNMPIEDSQLPLAEAPVGLRKKDGQWLVCGSASFSCKADQLLVLLPEQAVILEEQAELHRQETHDGFQFVYFSGTLEVNIDDDKYRLSSQSSASFMNQVRIEGQTLRYPTRTGQPVYLGMPDIRCDAAQAHLWVGGLRYAGAQSSSSYGVQTVKLKSPEGLTLFHKRLAILPADFSIKLQPGDSPSEGILLIKSVHNFFVSVTSSGEVSAKQVKQASAKRIELKAKEMPPVNVNLSVYANLEATAIELLVPFPAQGVLAFDSEGKALTRELVVDDLLGSRLQLFPKLNGRANYLLELLAGSREKGAGYEWIHQVKDAPMELSIYELRHHIRELFAVTPDDLDAQVCFRISGEGPTKTFMLRRYDCVVETEDFGISILQGGVSSDKDADPVLIDITDPKATPRKLTAYQSGGVNTGSFEQPKGNGSPCLIVPAKGSALNFRVKFVSGDEPDVLADPITSLYKAVDLFHPVERPDVISDVLILMSADFNHSGWQYLIDLFENYGYLPLTTFEVWKSISKNNEALCMLAFRLEQAPEVMERLQQEFNVLWEWQPLNAWRSAYNIYTAHWHELGLPVEAFSIVEAEKLNQLAAFAPMFDNNCRELISNKTGTSALMPKEMMNFVTQGWYQDLMRLHNDDNNWPTTFSKKLRSWYEQLDDRPVDIDIHVGFHASVVVLPVFAAAVVSGRETIEAVADSSPLNSFLLRQLLEFDRHWFIPIYQYCLTYFSSQE